MKIYENSKQIMKSIIKEEGLSEEHDFGYIDNMQSIFLRDKEQNWDDVLIGTKELFPKDSVKLLYRSKDPSKYKQEVDDKFPHLPGLKKYDSALFRQMNTIDTTQFGQKLR
jgi:hypothetical protein